MGYPRKPGPPSMPQPRIVVIIPAVDEEEAIGLVLAEIPPVAREVIVVDNGSRDRTAEVARAGGARAVHEARRGYRQACMARVPAAGGAPGLGLPDREPTERPCPTH